MRVYNKIGSKERLLEMFQGVNGVIINEIKVINSTDILELKFKELIGNLLNVNQSSIQVSDENSNVKLSCVDKQGNHVVFTISVIGTESDQDGVYEITSAKLVDFSYINKSEGVDINVNENELAEFNNKHVNELVNVASDYVDFEDKQTTEEMDEVYMNAVKKIDSYKTVNEADDYPSEIGKKFKTKKQYHSEKKKKETTTNISEIDGIEKFNVMNVGGVVEHPLSDVLNSGGSHKSIPKANIRGINRALKNTIN